MGESGELPRCIAETIRPHAIRRVSQDHIEPGLCFGELHPLTEIRLEELVLAGIEGGADRCGKLDVALPFFLFPQELESLVGGFRFGDDRIVKVFRNEDFLPDGVLIPAVAPTSKLFCGVGNGLGGGRSNPLCGKREFPVGLLLLRLPQGVEAGNCRSVLLPGEVTTLEVFVEFGLFGFEEGQRAEIGEGNVTVIEDLAVVGELPAKGENLLDSLEPAFPGNKYPILAFSAEDRGMKETSILDGVPEFLQRLGVEFLSLAVGFDDDGRELDCVHGIFHGVMDGEGNCPITGAKNPPEPG